MCGIVGIINVKLERRELTNRLRKCVRGIEHRGPDDNGIFIDRTACSGIGQTRLSILDLSAAGHQPMSSDDGKYTIVFNGEIYNYQELRTELKNAGAKFQSHTDTEVILQLYRQQGPKCISRLEGMFAFAIWDRDERTCFLARDPLGIKPLYIWQCGASLAFASEVRTLLEAQLGPKRICARALYSYFLFGSVQEPLTLVEQIEALPAGHTMMWRDGKSQINSFWELRFDADTISAAEAAKTARQALNESIQRHFVSDVPVGIFLSGGVDSTALVALAHANGFNQLQTFCISFNEHAFDEGSIAAKTAHHFGTKHFEWKMTPQEGCNLLRDYVQRFDQPSNDGFNTFCVSKFARDKGLKVVLSGLGGDELFGGYKSFQLIPKMVAWHRRIDSFRPIRNIIAGAGKMVFSHGKMRRLADYLNSAGQVSDAYRAIRGFFSPWEAKYLVSLYTNQNADILNCSFGIDSLPNYSMADAISYLEFTRYMRNQLLRDSDVFSMAWGLELRVPFVDQKLIDIISHIPATLRLRPGKKMLLEAIPEVPTWVAGEPKRGFAFPFEQWLKLEWRDLLERRLQTGGIPLRTWYRKWCLFMLNHFLEASGLSGEAVHPGSA